MSPPSDNWMLRWTEHHSVDTTTGGLLVPEAIIRLAVCVGTNLVLLDIFIFCNLQLLNNVIN